MRLTQYCLMVALSGMLVGCSADGTDEDVNSASLELRKGMGGVNGDGDFCTNSADRCIAGEGDCDNNFQCVSGLVCGTDNGRNFGQIRTNDVCVLAHCTNGSQDEVETGLDCGGADCGTCFVCPSDNGNVDMCSEDCLCSEGQGDCDGDAQCGEGLVCGDDLGDRFGLPTTTDVCVIAHCANGSQDADEEGIDCGGDDCGICTICSDDSNNGGTAFCSTDCLCDAGQGDCDSDTECAAGLVCAQDLGLSYGMNRQFDVCVTPTCAANPLGSTNFCTNGCPCGAGAGDCDTNAQCTAGLVCGTNNSDQFRDGAGQRGVTQFESCVLPHCINGIRDSGETGIDCGAGCGECLAAHCSNDVKDSTETGVDCGGADCGRCTF